MFGAEHSAAVRLAVFDEDLSHHWAARRFGIDCRTVKKTVCQAKAVFFIEAMVAARL